MVHEIITHPLPLLFQPFPSPPPAPDSHPLLISRPPASPQTTCSAGPLSQLPLTTSLSSLSWVLSRSPALPGAAVQKGCSSQKKAHMGTGMCRERKRQQLLRQQARRGPLRGGGDPRTTGAYIGEAGEGPWQTGALRGAVEGTEGVPRPRRRHCEPAQVGAGGRGWEWCGERV